MKSKKQSMITLPKVPIVKEIKFLGVIISEGLHWKSHVQHICSVASKRIYALRILKRTTTLSTDELTMIYNAVIRSILEYASPSFGNLPCGLAKMIDRIQSRCHRIICAPEIRTSCKCDRFSSLSIRRQNASLKLLKNALSQEHVLHSVAPRQSAKTGRLILPPTSTTRFLTFIPASAILMNLNIT